MIRQLKTVLVCVLLILPALPRSTVAAAQSGWRFALGAGVAIVPDYEGSQDYQLFPLPYATVEWEDVSFMELQGNLLRVNLLPSPTLQLGVALQFRRARDDVANTQVDNLRDVDAALEMGGFVGFTVGGWRTSLLVVQDTAGAHDGLLFTLSAGHTRSLGKPLTVRVGVSTTYADKNYMGTYFSVDAANAQMSGLPIFAAKEGLKDVRVNLTLRVRWSSRWSTLGIIEYARLFGDAANSPIVKNVGSVDQFSTGIIVIYSF